MVNPRTRQTLTAALAALVLIAVYAGMVLEFRTDLQREIHQKIIERDAAVLYPVAALQVAESESTGSNQPPNPYAPLTALLKGVRQQGMLGIAVFNRDGNTIEAVPATQLFVELPIDDYLRLQRVGSIARYHPAFPLDQYFAGVAGERRHAAVLEVLLALPDSHPSAWRGFVRYYIDARPLSRELAAIDHRIGRQTAVTLGLGAMVIGLVVTGSVLSLQRAQAVIEERNRRLTRANLELTLAAKVSVIGQITSNLIHGLQGAVAGLRSVVGSPDEQAGSNWESAAIYAERLQSMVQETVALLADTTANATYEFTGRELAAMIESRNKAAAVDKGVTLAIRVAFAEAIDSHRGSLLYLIANNLVQNAIAATEAGRGVSVSLAHPQHAAVLEVEDEGSGIPEDLRGQIFEPGRSRRPGGSGLGLAISQLLARQIGAELALVSTGTTGTVFRLTMPLDRNESAGAARRTAV